MPARRARSPRVLATLVSLVATLVAGLVVLLPAAPAGAATTSQLASSLISRINAYRTSYHLPALRSDSRLLNRSTSHTSLVARSGVFTLQFAGEPTTMTRLTQLNYHPAAATQVLGASWSQAGLMQQPGAMLRDWRRGAVLSRTYTNIGIDVQWSAKRRVYVTTVVFGRPQTLSQIYASSILRLINAERAAHRLPSLTMDSRLVTSAHRHNLAMEAQNVLSHQVSGEAWLGTRILDAGYRYWYAGENIAWTTDWTLTGVEATHEAMYNEVPPYDDHRLNILSPNYRNVGIDVVFDGARHKAWFTEDFGKLQ